MNKRENDILVRTYSVLHAVPGAHIGGGSTQSASIVGIMTFAKNMNAIKQPLEAVLYHVRIGEFDQASTLLTSLENWVKARKQSNWQSE